LRRTAAYPAPSYKDPNDRRLVQIITPSDRAEAKAINILGIPFDGAVLGRKGAAAGPGAIREALAGFSNYNVELGLGLDEARIFDLGDVVVDNGDVLTAHSAIESEVEGALVPDSLLVILGGDNSVSLPALRSYSGRFGRIGLVVFDSHLDLRGKIDGKPSSGSSYGLAIDEGVLSPKNVVEIGAHGFLNARHYVERAKNEGVTIFTAEDVSEKGARAMARAAYTQASRGTDAVYLSVDLDVVDIAQVSGVSAPSPGGIWARNLFMVAFELARNELVKCADIVELAPELDSGGKSQRVAATVLTYIVAGFHSRRKTRA
jgi:formiminoglutamase